MDFRRLSPLAILPALLLAGCGGDLRDVLSEDDARAEAIAVLTDDPSMRGELVDRLLSSADARVDLFRSILESEETAGVLVDEMMRDDRTRAVAATRIASDPETTRTFIGMMMLTGAVGEYLTQKQADCLELGDALAHGNQQRTMVALKRLGSVVDEWSRAHQGSYPVCDSLESASGCLASSLPDGALANLELDDAWGRPFLYRSTEDGTSYALISYATDGRSDGLGRAGPTSSFNADIVFADGEFVQWPGHIRRQEIR